MFKRFLKSLKRRRARPVRKAGKGSYRRKASSRGGVRGFFCRRVVAVACVRLAMAGIIVGGLAILYFAHGLPDISALNTIRKQQGITIETEDGRVVANYGDVYGTYMPYEQLPKPLIHAVLATEDRRFFSHHGVDFFGILRAMIVNARQGHLVQGGSTITQQLAKNVFLTPDRTMRRKIQEVLLAMALEHRYSKKEILAIYLNRVYLGSGAYGVDAASHRYFNKSVTDLSVAESAMLAGLLKAPSRYSPVASMARAQARVNQVLLNMVDAGYLDSKAVAPALESFKQLPAHETGGGEARYFTDWIIDQIPDYVGNTQDDLIVTSTMATTLQAAASDALQNVIATEGPTKNISEGALVAMTPDGAVKAMVGGINYAQSQYNRAAQAKRQPGSVFKLFVYLAALEAGYTPETPVLDAPVTVQVGNRLWSPNNFKADFKGEIPMVEGLRESLNTVSVRLSQMAGISRVSGMAERLGIPDVPEHPSIALGAVEATLLEMTGAFAHMPNHGNQVVPYGILAIKTRGGEELYHRDSPTQEKLLADSTVEMMNYMLLDVVRRGTGTRAGLPGRPAAGKTGTSQDYKDAWFIGFTPQLVAGVWIGNDDNAPMKHVTGGSVPAVIWHDFMTFAMNGLPVESIPNRSSSGLMPWLFGSSANPDNAPGIAAPVMEDAPLISGPQGAPILAPLPAPSPAKHKVEYTYPKGAKGIRH